MQNPLTNTKSITKGKYKMPTEAPTTAKEKLTEFILNLTDEECKIIIAFLKDK